MPPCWSLEHLHIGGFEICDGSVLPDCRKFTVEQGSETEEEEEDPEEPNLPHAAQLVIDTVLHQQPHESTLTQPEESAIGAAGAPAEVMESGMTDILPQGEEPLVLPLASLFFYLTVYNEAYSLQEI